MLVPVSSCAVQPTQGGGAAPSFVPGDKVQAWCYVLPGEVNPMQGKHTWTVNADGTISNDLYLGVDGAPIDPATVQATACLPCPCAGVPDTPPEPLTLTGQDCEGNPVDVTGTVGTLMAAVQPEGTVYKVQICDNAKDFKQVILCDIATGHKVAVTTDFSDPSAPTTSYWDLNTGAIWTGTPDQLENCPDSDTESDQVEMCDGGKTFLRWAVKKNGLPTGVKYDTTLDLQPYTVADETLVTPGACATAVAQITMQVVEMCDAGTTFLRHMRYEDGILTTVTDTALDGFNAHTVADETLVTAGICPAVCPAQTYQGVTTAWGA